MRAENGSRSASISRRHVLTAAAGAGAAAAVAGVGGAAPLGPVIDAPSADPGAAEVAGPVIVHLRDVASGALDVFSGTERIHIRDRTLAERIARAAANTNQNNGSL